mgnify:FL=1
MRIRFVPRSEIKISKKSSSKFKPLIEALDNLEPGGQAVKVNYDDEKELNSMRNVVYTYNRDYNEKIKSGKDSRNNTVYFYKE